MSYVGFDNFIQFKVKMNRKEMVAALDEYYASISRIKTPQYDTYSLSELRKCLILFKLNSNSEK